MKLGGMGMHMFGFDFDKKPLPPSSDELVRAWRPFVETCVEAFGVKRAMFESNFPIDKRYYSYGVMWNAFKKLAATASAAERRSFSSTPPSAATACRRRPRVFATSRQFASSSRPRVSGSANAARMTMA